MTVLWGLECVLTILSRLDCVLGLVEIELCFRSCRDCTVFQHFCGDLAVFQQSYGIGPCFNSLVRIGVCFNSLVEMGAGLIKKPSFSVCWEDTVLLPGRGVAACHHCHCQKKQAVCPHSSQCKNIFQYSFLVFSSLF